ncbi:MAG: hypothetical protein ACK5N0_09440 [Synechococcaceae cyanobacterium]
MTSRTPPVEPTSAPPAPRCQPQPSWIFWPKHVRGRTASRLRRSSAAPADPAQAKAKLGQLAASAWLAGGLLARAAEARRRRELRIAGLNRGGQAPFTGRGLARVFIAPLGALLPLATLAMAPLAPGHAEPLPLGLAPGGAMAPAPGLPLDNDNRPRAQRMDGTSLSQPIFRARLQRDDLDGLDELCRLSAAAGDNDRLSQLRQRLLERPLQPVSLAKILATAEVLLSCRAPAAALTVLDRFSPDRGGGRVQWLLMQWRAAHANLDHRLAARALERLTEGKSDRLAGLKLALTRPGGAPGTASVATPPRRAAVDLLADHLESRGRPAEAAERLLAAARLPIAAGDGQSRILRAERLHRAVSLLDNLPPAERERLLEPALEQAAAAGAWGLVVEMLDQQIQRVSPRALERRLRLSPRLDDAYGEWRLRQQNPGDQQRLKALEERLRSPRQPGGHAADPAADRPMPTAAAEAAKPMADRPGPSPGSALPASFSPRPAMP